MVRRSEAEGEGVGDEQLVLAGIDALDVGIGDMAVLHAEARAAGECVSGAQAQAELEGAAEILAAAAVIAAGAGERRDHDIAEANIGVESGIAEDAALAVAEHAQRGTEMKELAAVAQLEPALGRIGRDMSRPGAE